MTWKTYERPADSAGSNPEGATATESGGTEDITTPPEDQVSQLKSDLAAARSELERCQDRFLRKAAEFDNYRKRMDKEKLEFVILAKSSVLAEFLPVSDACERALESLNCVQENDCLEQYREGVRLLYRQLNAVLGRLGVVPLEAQGQEFDPHLHEAVTREESFEHEENTVLLELRRGYLFNDRLLRPAQVKVSTRPRPKDTPDG